MADPHAAPSHMKQIREIVGLLDAASPAFLEILIHELRKWRERQLASPVKLRLVRTDEPEPRNPSAGEVRPSPWPRHGPGQKILNTAT